MPTAAALRALLGDSVRFSVDLTRFPEGWSVGAVWTCGCSAEGSNFSELRVEPCERHRDIIPVQFRR